MLVGSSLCFILVVSPSQPAAQSFSGADVIVVLGCRAKNGRPGPALTRRLVRASEVHDSTNLPVIMSGGKKWQGKSESDAMNTWWLRSGRDCSLVHQEQQSESTRENAHYVSLLCKERGYREIILVTCSYHMPRARRLFLDRALQVTEAVAQHPLSPLLHAKLTLREWGARILELRSRTP